MMNSSMLVRACVVWAMVSISQAVSSAHDFQVLQIKSLIDSPAGKVAIRLNEVMWVKVSDLKRLLETAKLEEKGIVPFINDMPIDGVFPISYNPNSGRNTIGFHLERNDQNREVWVRLLGSPNPFNLNRPVEVSVGFTDGTPFPVALKPYEVPAGEASKPGEPPSVASGQHPEVVLQIIHPFWGIVVAIMLVIVLGLMIYLARKSNLIRDFGANPEEGKRKPYSLAYAQMAWWFGLAILAFLSIWLVTGSLDTINATVLTLIGIGSATALGARIQDENKDPRKKWNERIDELKRKPSRSQDEEMEMAALTQKVESFSTPAVSEGLLKDVLTDRQGVSFHRFQMFAWTLILGLIFLKEAYSTLAMPELNGTLLALLGISSGTYIGFMIPETHSSEQSKKDS